VAQTDPRVTDAELAVLKELWDQGASTIRQLTDRLYPGGSAAHYATVQKLLERLEAKGCVTRHSAGRAHSFAPAVDRARIIERRLRETADKLCEGSLTPLLTQLVGSARLSKAELASLRDLVRRLEPGGE
jgi:predicted transcriptional regulator